MNHSLAGRQHQRCHCTAGRGSYEERGGVIGMRRNAEELSVTGLSIH